MRTLGQRRVTRRRLVHRSTPLLTGVMRVCAVLFMAAAWLMLAPAGRAVAAGGLFVAPLPDPRTVLSAFSLPGQPWLAGNRGVDLAASSGEPVFAAAAGKVLYAGALAGRGVISIDHGTIRTTYEPVDPVVHAGDVVTQGQLIGRVADTADACGPPGSCLHWGAITTSGYVDPMSYLSRPTIRLLPIWGDSPLEARAIGVASPPWPPTGSPRAIPARTEDAAAATETGPPKGGATVTTPTVVVATTAVLGAAVGLKRHQRRCRRPGRINPTK